MARCDWCLKIGASLELGAWMLELKNCLPITNVEEPFLFSPSASSSHAHGIFFETQPRWRTPLLERATEDSIGPPARAQRERITIAPARPVATRLQSGLGIRPDRAPAP